MNEFQEKLKKKIKELLKKKIISYSTFYTWEELTDLIRSNGIKTYWDMIQDAVQELAEEDIFDLQDGIIILPKKEIILNTKALEKLEKLNSQYSFFLTKIEYTLNTNDKEELEKIKKLYQNLKEYLKSN